jgi:hypothetical protein
MLCGILFHKLWISLLSQITWCDQTRILEEITPKLFDPEAQKMTANDANLHIPIVHEPIPQGESLAKSIFKQPNFVNACSVISLFIIGLQVYRYGNVSVIKGMTFVVDSQIHT